MNRQRIYLLLVGTILTACFLGAAAILTLIRYADVAAGGLGLAMAIFGVWASARGMACLTGLEKLPNEQHDAAYRTQLETAYRYRNAGIAVGITGSGLLVFSWQTFLGRFINM